MSRREYDERAGRGLNWLKTYGEQYGLDVSRVPISYGLDMSNPDQCVLAWALVEPRADWTTDNMSRFKQALARLRPGFYSPDDFGVFVVSHGFDLEVMAWRQRLVPASVKKDWRLLTLAWKWALLGEGRQTGRVKS